MGRTVLDQPRSAHEPAPIPTISLRQLDRALDQELTRACALVGNPSGASAQVVLAATAGAHPLPLFWASCNARAAELCNTYGVEMLVVEEDGRIRIRVDRFQASPSQQPAIKRRFGWWHRLWSGRR